MLTFGWELFLECCLDERFERVMAEFAEINRRLGDPTYAETAVVDAWLVNVFG